MHSNWKIKEYRFCPVCKTKLIKEKETNWFHYTCPSCGWIYYKNPLPSVAALIVNEKNEILLIRRGIEPGRGEWALPTGFIEQSELPEQAVLRELKEETGLKGKVKNLIGIYTDRTNFYGDILLIGYEVEALGGHIKAGSDCDAVRFYSWDKLPRIPFASHRSVIRDYLNKKARGGYFVEVLKSKITKAVITDTVLFYKGSMGIDQNIMDAANLIPGEKVQVLNYDNGERIETYTIAEKRGSGRIVLYGPASLKGKAGDKLCILGYAFVDISQAKEIRPKIVTLDRKNKIRSIKG